HGLANQPANGCLAVVLDQHPGPVRVGQPQHAGADAVDVVVEDVVPLAGQLVDSIHVNGAGRLAFVNRQQFLGNATVDLAGAREHDLRLGRDAPARIEQSELAATVDLQVSKRILHGVDVADLTGQIEDDGLAADKALHGQD